MKLPALAAAALLASAPAAFAAPAAVTVAIGPELQAKAEKTYGVRDVQMLADHLKADVERELGRTRVHDGATVELTLVDAIPNRPTFKQMGDVVGLSYQSFGNGGAAIEGKVTGPDGKVTPLSYQWYESDIRWAWSRYTWADAEWTLGRFAARLGRGETLASR